MDKFEEKMDKLARFFENRADRIIEKADKAEESGKTTTLRSFGILPFFNIIVIRMFILTLWFGYRAYRVTKNGDTTIGTVSELAESPTEDGCCVYSPVVEYWVDGQTYVFESSHASSPPRYQLGQQVEVIYDRASPSKGNINSWSELWLLPGVFGLATLLIIIALNFYPLLLRRKSEPVVESGD